MLATSVYVEVFRVVHILGAIGWGGAVFMIVFFLQPTAKAIGPAAGPFMAELLGKRRLVSVVLWIAAATIVAGGFLYWHDWQTVGSLGDFLGIRFGLALSLGAISALIAFFIGMLATKPAVDRLLSLGAQAAQAGGPPPPELGQQIQDAQAHARTLAKVNFAFVAFAALAMSTARYW